VKHRRTDTTENPKTPERLRLLLEYHGLTQRELAALAGVSPPSVNQWLSGETSPSLRSCLRIADALDESLDFILGREGSRRGRIGDESGFEDPTLREQPTAWIQWRQRFGLFLQRVGKPWRGETREQARKRALEIAREERLRGALERLEGDCLEERDLEALYELAYHAFSTANPQPAAFPTAIPSIET